LVAIFALASAITGGLIYRQERDDARAIARLKAPISTLRAARAAMDTATREIAVLSSHARSRTQVGAILRLISVTLPDSSCLTTLLLTIDRGGSLEGLALNPRTVVAALNGEHRLPHATLQSVASGGPGPATWTRFSLTFGEGYSR
jgi:hypothetical protein